MPPKAFKFDSKAGPKPKVIEPKDVSDSKTYPEAYRKTKHVKGSNDNCPDPFRVARIIAIYFKEGKLKLKVGKFYRPEDTHRGVAAGYQSNFNVVFWSDEEAVRESFLSMCACCLLYILFSLQCVHIIGLSLGNKGPLR